MYQQRAGSPFTTTLDHIMTNPRSSDACPKCGGELFQTDKNTFTGKVWREYTCRSCGHIVDVDEGTALWQVLHDDAEKAKLEKKEK